MHELLEPTSIKPQESGLLKLVPDPQPIKRRVSRRAMVIEHEPVVIDDSSEDKSLISAQLFVGLMAAVFLAGGGFVSDVPA